MKKEQKTPKNQVIEKGISKLQSSVRYLRKKDFYTAAPCAKQSGYETTLIATVISHNILDCTVDPQGSMFYASSLKPLVQQIVAAFNEKMVVDIDQVMDLTYRLWIIRHSMAIGDLTPWQYLGHFKTMLPKPNEVLVRELFAGMEVG